MPDVFVSDGSGKKDRDAEPQRESLPGHTHNPLASYIFKPDPEKIDFETKDAREKVVLLLRKHPITNVPWIIIAGLMLVAPSVLGVFPILSFLPANFQVVAIFFWYLVTAAFILESFLIWFFNVYIITDERVVDIDFVNLIYKQVSDAKIDKIQDVTYNMGGVIRTIFNYGNVTIQTAAEIPEFEFNAVPKPDQVAKTLQELMVEEEQEKIEGRVR